MFTVAVCDDNEEQLQWMTSLLREYALTRSDANLHICSFLSGKSLLCSEACVHFDLYLLDVLMPECDGIAVGLRLRAMGAEGAIIYLTSSRDYAVESYQARAFYYLLKPPPRDELFSVLDRVLDTLEQQKKERFLLTTREGILRISLDEILYAERAGRVMRCHCVKRTLDSLTLRIPFREAAAPLLADSRFCPCGASFVLNYRHIHAIEGDTAVMDNGTQLPLPRRFSTQVKQGWINYWMERGM